MFSIALAAAAIRPARPYGPVWKVGLWFAVLFGVFIVLGLILYILRGLLLRKTVERNDSRAMEQIDSLHRQGVLTDEEYRRARRAVLGLTGRDDSAAKEEETETDEKKEDNRQ